MHERKARIEYSPDLDKLTRKKRVCAYARVSSDNDEAFHSLSAQISYYQSTIASHPEWEFVEVFTDRGITGTSENRDGFKRMLSACRNKEVDIVLTKSITRFARNTLILLETIRELKSLEIDVRFEEEHINTLSTQGELMISVLAARAQEESRQVSENQKWKIRKSYENGIPITGNCLGYRMVDHQFLIDDEEADTVRLIFALYLSGMGTSRIAKYLHDNGFKTHTGKTNWTQPGVRGILQNEKYVGDLILQKGYTNNHVEKKRVTNHGELPQYYVQDDHDAIIDRETFEKVQQEFKRRSKPTTRNYRETYPFTHLLFCSKCGCAFCRKSVRSYGKVKRPFWRSYNYDIFGPKECDCRQIPEEILNKKTCEALGVLSLDGIDPHDSIEKILATDRFDLEYHFKDGSKKKLSWSYPPRSERWTPERKEKARLLMLQRFGAEKIGRNDHGPSRT